MTKTEIRELDALKYASLPQLPEPLGQDTPIWIRAIGKVRMNNLSVGYAIVRNTFTDTPRTEKIFGDGSIASIVSIHPYEFLDAKYLPNISGEKEARAFVARAYGLRREQVRALTKENVRALIYNYCAKRQLAKEDVTTKNNENEEREENG